MWSERPVSAWSGATGAEQFEKLWWQDVQKKNWAGVEARMSSTYVAVSRSGARDRAESLEHLRKLEIAEFSLGDVQVAPHGNDLVVTYALSLRGSWDGKPLELDRVRMMTVWQEHKNGWVAIAHSESGP